MVENSMEVRSTCAFHIITKITPKRMKNLCQGQGGKALTPSIRTSQENAAAGTQGPGLRVEDPPLVLYEQGAVRAPGHKRE